MKAVWINGFLATFFVFVSFLNTQAQDLHYSQFYNSPMNINPALTGVFNGDHRFYGSIRDQWRFVPVPWFTFTGAYDRKIYPKKSEKYFLGLGGLMNHDRQGDSKLNLTSVIGSVAYHRILAPKHIVSGGLQLGLASRGFDTRSLTWDKQWDKDIFNPNIDPGEQFKNLERVNFMESAVGLNYRFQKSSRTHVDAGIGVLHAIKPKTAFKSSDDIRIPHRITYSAIGNVMLTSKFDVQLQAIYQTQNEYNETLYGGLVKYYLNGKRGKDYQLHLGIGHRTAGSWFPSFAVQVNQFYGSISYDFDATGYNDIVSSNRGGPEMHFRYIITNVRPLNKFKNCPIY
jgi:type IX secretion system PorP/SprF family membrane protein